MDQASKHLPVAVKTQSHSQSLSAFLATRRQVFTEKLGRDFEIKRRSRDMRLVFQSAVRQKYKNLSVVWLPGKHGNLAKILFTTYSPSQLREMIDAYVEQEQYHQERGLSFDGFYWAAAKIATDIAAAHTRTEVISTRQKQIQIIDAADPTAADIERFKQSAFFKKLPKLFQEKLRGEAPG